MVYRPPLSKKPSGKFCPVRNRTIPSKMNVSAVFRIFLHSFLSISIFFFSALPLSAETAPEHWAATAHPLATETALQILQEGGNAVDAAIAAQWVLNVVEPQSSGIGGGGFFLFYEKASGQIYAFDGREAAPAAVDPSLFLDEEEKPLPYLPDRVTGGHSVGVPGVLRLLETVHNRFSSGRFEFGRLLEPAIEVAESGFTVSPRLAQFIENEKSRLTLFPDSRRIFLTENGEALAAGTVLKQPELAETFRLIRDRGTTVFYQGEIAESIVEAVQQAPYRPGRMTQDDLYYYEVKLRDPVRGFYRGYEIISMGPPSSGGLTLIETLQILEHWNVPSWNRNVRFFHVFSEAQKLAFRDRNRWIGDPDFAQTGMERMLAPGLARSRSEQIREDRIVSAGQPEPSGTQTSHISIVDAAGNMVSFTTTIEHVFGSAMIVPGRGFFLNNELSDFNAEPWDEANQLHPNAPQGSKRPRSSMTPAFVFRDGEPFMVAGSPGGSSIIGIVLNVLVNVLDFGLPVHEAVALPRVINRDGEIELETPLYEQEILRRGLEMLGHEVKRRSPFGNAQVLLRDPETGKWTGASDPRGEGLALGVPQ